jgi:hypothetical protein
MFRRVFVGDNERVFLIRNGRFEDLLTPGEHRVFGSGVQLERHDLSEVTLTSQWEEFLVREKWTIVSLHFTLVETGDLEVAIVYFDDQVSRVVGPGRRVLFWNGPVTVTYDLIDVRCNAQVPAFLTSAILRLGPESQATAAVVADGQRGRLYYDGSLVRELGPGTYAFWNAAGPLRVDGIHLIDEHAEMAVAAR